MSRRAAYTLTWLRNVGGTLSPTARQDLVTELRELTATCLDPLPDYQVLSGDVAVLERAVLTLARRPDGTLAGFCSALMIPVPGVGEVFHLGLTCVHPDDRGAGLTHMLLSRSISEVLLRRNPLKGVWFSNVASVLSSLGNVALYFDDVHPSPFRTRSPSVTHRAIATHLSAHEREAFYIADDVAFDAHRSVFVAANADRVFHKTVDEVRYHHRNKDLTDWYVELADLDRGDAVLQVGRVHFYGFLSYAVRQWLQRIPVVKWWVKPPELLPLHIALGGTP